MYWLRSGFCFYRKSYVESWMEVEINLYIVGVEKYRSIELKEWIELKGPFNHTYTYNMFF